MSGPVVTSSPASPREKDASSPGPLAGAGATVLSFDAAAALAALGSSRRGLDEAEAARRRAAAGPNVLPPPPRRSVAAELAAQLANMFAVVLMVAAALTFGIYFLSVPRDRANLVLAFGICGVVVLNALIGFAQEHAAERTAQALQAMVPHRARVVRGGELTEIPAEDLVPGDVMVLEAGDAVSADARVIEAHAMSVELAALTGESQPSGRTADPASDGVVPAEARDGVFMGTSVTTGTGKAVVFATGLSTEFGRIYRLTAGLPPEQSPLQRQVSDMARRVAAVAVGTGALLFALRVLTGSQVALSFVFALGVMVALVPEGLPATLSVSLAIGVRRMARRQALIKRLAAVEALGSTTVICTDKTGTLTKAEMTVQQVYASGLLHQVTGVGYAPEGEVQDAAAVAGVLRAGALCSDARLLAPEGSQGWRVLGDTTEGAILAAAAKAGIDLDAEAARAPRAGAFPFDPGRKLMTTIHQVGDSFEAYVKGSPQAVLDRCADAWWDGRAVPMDAGLRGQIGDANDAMAARALRVLAVARKPVASPRVGQDEAEHGLTFLGLVAMIDPPRPEVTAAVGACHRAGISIYMVTGDYGLTAEAVARRVGIVGAGPAQVVTGADLDAMDDEALAGRLRAGDQVIFARVRPEHKLRVVATLERLGEIVAVTGDGANDAPALKRASVGVSMGQGGTDVARAASVMVLLDDSFASIAAAVELGRAVYQNIRRFLVYLFSHNLAELAPILAATFAGFPLVPLSALQVLAIDLGSDVLPALALGAERPEPGTMDRPPRPPAEHLFNWPVVRRFLFLGTIQSIGVVFAFFWRIHTAHLPYAAFTAANPTYREALTMTQAGIVVSQFFNSLTVRTDRESVLRAGLWSNPPLIAAGCIGLAFMAAVSYVPALQSVFNTAPLRVSDWLILIAFGVLLLAADEARKAWHRRAARARPGGPQPAGPAAPASATGRRAG
ncbi:MAG TPA: cation-transporting P-type ATPase [Streptosporangiaceae bacterium]|nr:cation-transporting P-type ATPase [Streptosporangiaceae bacterium]